MVYNFSSVSWKETTIYNCQDYVVNNYRHTTGNSTYNLKIETSISNMDTN